MGNCWNTSTEIEMISEVENPKYFVPDEVGSGVGVDKGSVHLQALFKLCIL
jgi:hypothetical protein